MLTRAMYEARELAMTRMEEEADLLGADGVVGVRLVFKQYAMDEGVLEFQAIGTAIRHRDAEGQLSHERQPALHVGPERTGSLEARARRVSSGQSVDGRMCLSHRSLEFHAGAQAGRSKSGDEDLHRGDLCGARAGARAHAGGSRAGGGIGVVGARVEESNWGWGANAIEFFAVGTAVTRMDGAELKVLSDVQQVVTFNGAG